MNYEDSSEYVNAQLSVMEVPNDQHWPFTPHFRKCVCMTIQELFKVKIISVGINPVDMDQCLIFVDDHHNRWVMSLVESPHNPESNVIYMRFPRSNTPTCTRATIMPSKSLNDPAVSFMGQSLIVYDTGCWGDSL